MYKIPANTLFLGKNLVYVPECHSTNTLALEFCHEGSTPDGTLVITRMQTTGRGQRGSQWESQPGENLTFSLVLKPSFLAVKDQFYLNMFTALSIRDFLAEKCSASVVIKWPNDILGNEFKICGILIETQISGDRFKDVVVGVGLNVNQQHFTAPFATSLSLITRQRYDLQVLLEGLLAGLEARYLQLRQNKSKELKKEYLKHLYRINERHTFSSGHDLFEGEIIGVDEHGRLKILTDGKERNFGIKEISFR